MHDETDLKLLWLHVRASVVEMQELDPTRELHGHAWRHSYDIEPVIDDYDILEYERLNKLELPISYRTYLQYFGASGPSAYGGTFHFKKYIFNQVISNTSKLIPFEGFRDCEDDHTPLWVKHDGMVQIAHGWNPLHVFLIVRGVSPGTVFYDTGDILGCEGDFAVWYAKWADDYLRVLHERVALKNLPAGSAVSDLESVLSTSFFRHRTKDGIDYLCISHGPESFTESVFQLKVNGTIEKFYSSWRAAMVHSKNA